MMYLFTLCRAKSHDVGAYYNLMNTLNTSSGAYTATFHSPSDYDMQSDRTVYDIFLCMHT